MKSKDLFAQMSRARHSLSLPEAAFPLSRYISSISAVSGAETGSKCACTPLSGEHQVRCAGDTTASASRASHRERSSLLPTAALGIFAASLLSQAQGHCDAQDPSDSPEFLVQSLWTQVMEDIERSDAKLPRNVSHTKIASPILSRVGGDNSLSVVLPVRDGVDLNALRESLLESQASPMYHPNPDLSKPRSLFTSSNMSWRQSRQSVSLVINNSAGKRKLSLTIPADHMEQPPTIEVIKSGPLESEDLAYLAHVMTLANDLQPTTSNPLEQLLSPYAKMGVSASDPLDVASLQHGLEDLSNLFSSVHNLLNSELSRHDGSTSQPPHYQSQRHQTDSDDGSTATAGAGSQTKGAYDSEEAVAARGRAAQQAAVRSLEELGARVYTSDKDNDEIEWGQMAGYEEQKSMIEDIVLLAISNPGVYARMAERTRKDQTAQRTKAVLFEGPPGTGKTTSARIIAKQASVPLIYIPLEAVASKWYGESEQKLSQMLQLSEDMGGCIIFLDEIDSLATERGDGMNEATRRLLGVLLRFIDGFEPTKSLVIAATNRKQDLDSALISRFDAIINFGLPDSSCRSDILQQYASHLSTEDLEEIASRARGMSARDLRSICEVTERKWASAIIRGKQAEDSLPDLDAYLASTDARQRSL